MKLKRNNKEKTVNSLDSFQLEEYKNISTAHFESVKQISTFFRYYLLILAAPALIFQIISGMEGGINKFLEGKSVNLVYDIASWYFIIIGFIGFFIYLYVINLRLDAVLYARAVNKVRRYFFHNSRIEINKYERYLPLPIINSRPKYFEKTFFIPILFVFSVLNCGFILIGLKAKLIHSAYFIYSNLGFNLPISNITIFAAIIIFFGLHIWGYIFLVSNRNNHYLKSYFVGIDIDGVLNNQTSHFVEWLKKLTDKDIKAEDILEIPVSLNEKLGITSSEEKLVFNTREYWETLPPRDNGLERINDFQKKFGFNIYIFTYRDWPQYSNDEKNIRDIIKSKGYNPLEKSDIRNITRKWLVDNGFNAIIVHNSFTWLMFHITNIFIKSKRVTIELGNPYISDTRFSNNFRKTILNNNRFQGASRNGFKFFIEDNPENAIKMADFCEYVFMFNEPYNKADRYDFPKNVIRVDSWNDIYRYFKLFS